MTTEKAKLLQLYVIRHGETLWSLSGQHTGRTDLELIERGEDDARAIGRVLEQTAFDYVFTSPRVRARRTCELANIGPAAVLENALAEWDYGDYEGLRSAEICLQNPAWVLYRDGCPHGETPEQVRARADRLLARLRGLAGNVALFTHGQFSSVLAARWIGLPVVHAQHFPLGTASLGILSYALHHREVPVIEQWNGTEDANVQRHARASKQVPRKAALERWENEGGATRPANYVNVATKKLVVFDLDGTLAESKAAIDPEMAGLLANLLQTSRVAIISGGDWPQFQIQVVSHLPPHTNLKSLSLLPTCGTKFYQYSGDWELVYEEDFSSDERASIVAALKSVVASSGFAPARMWGEVIEDRGSQITFSALGQQAPLDEKTKWDPDFTKRKAMQKQLTMLIPTFSVRLGGSTSIDITKPGIDKAYGIRKLRDFLGIDLSEMMFVGDALFPGGNDYPAKKAGVVSVQVRDSHETKRVIETFLACASAMQTTPE